jgi:hypothetical protein
VTITQDATTLTIEYVSNSRAHAPVKLVYSLDGSERQNTDKNSLTPERSSRATWRESHLVLTTVIPRVSEGKPDPLEITEELALDSSGTLSVQITRRSKLQTDSAVVAYKRIR